MEGTEATGKQGSMMDKDQKKSTKHRLNFRQKFAKLGMAVTTKKASKIREFAASSPIPVTDDVRFLQAELFAEGTECFPNITGNPQSAPKTLEQELKQVLSAEYSLNPSQLKNTKDDSFGNMNDEFFSAIERNKNQTIDKRQNTWENTDSEVWNTRPEYDESITGKSNGVSDLRQMDQNFLEQLRSNEQCKPKTFAAEFDADIECWREMIAKTKNTLREAQSLRESLSSDLHDFKQMRKTTDNLRKDIGSLIMRRQLLNENLKNLDNIIKVAKEFGDKIKAPHYKEVDQLIKQFRKHKGKSKQHPK